VIKRFKELLKAQRDRFQSYLSTLDTQKEIIQSGSTDDLLRHVELEEKIVSDIFSIQKVIDPLEKMYHSININHKMTIGNHTEEEEVSGLREVLENLKTEALVRSHRNRELLSKRMAELRAEIKSLKSNTYAQKRFENNVIPTFIDIHG
jgi:H2-forming N5,N10-methylenetetrahydromethanopterin dehydrogenase-like enzyme